MPGDVELCRAPLCIMYVLYRSVSNSHARTHSLTHDTIQYVEYVAPKQPQAGGLRTNQEGGGGGGHRDSDHEDRQSSSSSTRGNVPRVTTTEPLLLPRLPQTHTE